MISVARSGVFHSIDITISPEPTPARSAILPDRAVTVSPLCVRYPLSIDSRAEGRSCE